MDESLFTIWASVLLISATLLTLRLIAVLPATYKNPLIAKVPVPVPKSTPHKPVDLLVLLGSGGHTGEMIRILDQFHTIASFKRRYVVSSGDDSSLLSITKFEKTQGTGTSHPLKYLSLPRARNIGEGRIMATINTLRSFAVTIFTFSRGNYPDLFLCNGPGTAIPIAYTLFVLKFLGLCHTKIVYVESLARVKQLSLTGLLILPISDRIIVQWEALAKRYRRCEWYGVLV